MPEVEYTDISLLYPDAESLRRAELGHGARLTETTAEQLELYYLIDSSLFSNTISF